MLLDVAVMVGEHLTAHPQKKGKKTITLLSAKERKRIEKKANQMFPSEKFTLPEETLRELEGEFGVEKLDEAISAVGGIPDTSVHITSHRKAQS